MAISKSAILRGLILLAAAVCPLLQAGAGVLTGEFTYYDDGRHSRVECMRLAAEHARIEALAREFGTTVSQNLMQTDRMSNDRETNDFLALSQTEVRGEWLGDIGEPKYDISMDKDGNLVVKCTVKGNARAISNEAVEFEGLLLRNGTSRQHAETHFKNKDSLYLLVNAPCSGQLSVFLEDESRQVIQLLPYPEDQYGHVTLKKGRDYIFFSRQHDKGEFGPAEELELTASENLEYNRIFMVFSPSAYSLPVTRSAGGLGSMTSADFNKWLIKSRNSDPKMAVKTVNIEITE